VPDIVSYAQRFEDLYVMRCFGGRAGGFYIDIGSGHPVYDNMSLAFYLKGWRGVTVEPNPWLARLTRAVRPRDRHVEAVIGAVSGQATFHVVREFHGLSTTIADHAAKAQSQFGRAADEITVPMLTLKELCALYAPPRFEFLKVDVEGAEPDVLLNGDWQNFRPEVVIVEALAPFTLAPAFEQWEPFLARYGYRYVLFDSLNRYYLAEEAGALADCFDTAPGSFDEKLQFRNVKPAISDVGHPDHRLATLLARAAMTRLPLFEPALILELLTADLPAPDLARRANAEDISQAMARLFGPGMEPDSIRDMNLPTDATVQQVYAGLIDTDTFRVACGRISASYAW
jgi:FkbM family methyltransferase